MSQTAVPEVGTYAQAAEAYAAAKQPFPAPIAEMARWLVDNGLYDPSWQDKVKSCARDLGEYFRRKTRNTATGARVRKYLSARMPYVSASDGKTRQTWLWDDAATCSAEFAHAAIRQMERQIERDCESLRATAAWVNEHNPNLHATPVQLALPFGAAEPDPAAAEESAPEARESAVAGKPR